MMIEDTLGYREMMRMTQILRLIEPDIVPVTEIDQDPFLRRSIFCFSFALLSLTTRRFFGNHLPIFNNVHQSFSVRSPFLKY